MAERNLDFDKITERRGTNCLKYDFAVKRGKPGDGGRGFQRINVACPRAVLEEALTKLEWAVTAWRLEVSRNEN